MASNSRLKLKVLYIMKILMELTDERHSLTVNEIIEELIKYNITAERKSVYADIKLLQEFGVDIICMKGRNNKYFIGGRDFELPELKLLVDSVQSSRFITSKKSQELIRKLEKLTSVYEAKELLRDVALDRIKSTNENIYYIVYEVNRAIQNNKQIRFKYFEYNLDKQIEYRREGEWYYLSPYAFIWNDDNYYLIGYYERYSGISNFRVDRMTTIEPVEEERFFNEDTIDFNVAEYSKKIFRMYSGDIENVKLQFDNTLINVVIDRFGKDIEIHKISDKAFIIKIEVAVTNTFLSWLFMFEDRVEIIEPITLREKMLNLAKKVISMYSEIENE